MSKIIKLSVACLALAALTSAANAATVGTYVGGGLGASVSSVKNDPFNITGATSGTTSKSLGGLGGRVFAGYNFNRYFGLEAGYAKFARSLYQGTFNTSSSSLRYTTSALDVVGKGYLPLGDSGFNLFAGAGAALVNSKVKYSNNGVPLASGFIAPNTGTTTTYRVRPTVAVGAGYDFNPQWTTNLEYNFIAGQSNEKTNGKLVPSAGMLTLNLVYNLS